MLLLGKFGQLGYPWLDYFRAAAGVFGVGVRWGGEIGRAAAGICYGGYLARRNRPWCCWDLARGLLGEAKFAALLLKQSTIFFVFLF